VKNRRASCIVCYDFVYNDSSCYTIQNKTCSNPLQQSKRHSRYVMQTSVCWWWFVILLSDVLCSLWVLGLVATSPICWEAYLPWMSPGWVSPEWGYSILYPIWGVAIDMPLCYMHTGCKGIEEKTTVPDSQVWHRRAIRKHSASSFCVNWVG